MTQPFAFPPGLQPEDPALGDSPDSPDERDTSLNDQDSEPKTAEEEVWDENEVNVIDATDVGPEDEGSDAGTDLGTASGDYASADDDTEGGDYASTDEASEVGGDDETFPPAADVGSTPMEELQEGVGGADSTSSDLSADVDADAASDPEEVASSDPQREDYPRPPHAEDDQL